MILTIVLVVVTLIALGFLTWWVFSMLNDMDDEMGALRTEIDSLTIKLEELQK